MPDRNSLRGQRFWPSILATEGEAMAEKPGLWQQEKVVKAVHITEDKETESVMRIIDGMTF